MTSLHRLPVSALSVLFGDAYWTQVWAQSLHLQVMPFDEGAGVAVNWMRLLEHLGQDFVSVALTGSCLVSSVIGDLLFLFSSRPPSPCGQSRGAGAGVILTIRGFVAFRRQCDCAFSRAQRVGSSYVFFLVGLGFGTDAAALAFFAARCFANRTSSA